MKIFVLYNVLSRQALNHDLRPEVEKKLEENHELTVRSFHPQDDNFNDFLGKHFSTKDYDVIMIVGGDGTLRTAIEYVYKQSGLDEVAFVFVPYGTANVSTGLLNLPESASWALDNFDDLVVKDHDIGVINDQYVFLLGVTFGGLSSLFEKIDGSPWKRVFGKLSYFFIILFHWSSFQKRSFEIIVDQKEKSLLAHNLFVSLAKTIGEVRPMKEGEAAGLEGRFFRSSSFFDFVRSVFKFFLTKDSSSFFQGKEIFIKTPLDLEVQVDGDLISVEKESGIKVVSSSQKVRLYGKND